MRYLGFSYAIWPRFGRLYAWARVTKLKDSMPADLDWEQVAKLTGDVAGLKRQITATNNRMNGFESSKGRAIDAQAAVQALAQQQAQTNVSYLGG